MVRDELIAAIGGVVLAISAILEGEADSKKQKQAEEKLKDNKNPSTEMQLITELKRMNDYLGKVGDNKDPKTKKKVVTKPPKEGEGEGEPENA